MDIDFSQLPFIGDATASRERFLYCAHRGFLKHAISKARNGYGDGFGDLVVAHEAMGKECRDPGLVLSLNAHIWGALFPIQNYGSLEQLSFYVRNLICGEWISGHAISEIQAGSDLNSLETVAQENTDGFLLTGRKRYITNAPIADILIVYALLDRQLTAFIVHRDDRGADFLNGPKTSGCSSSTMGDVVLNHCLIPHQRQLGKAGGGSMIIQQALEQERAFVFAGLCGVMAWQLDEVIDFSRKRKVNGAHLGKLEAISHKIAEMKLRLDTVRLWLNECVRLKENKERITLASAQTKLLASESFLQSSLDAVHILGGSGLLEDSPMLGFVHDAIASRLFSGSSEIQKNIIAALLGTGDGYKGG
ncbi:MAG: acyl-CoA dehydrogenase [Pseudomonadales bacterium]|nr:acyl-CoA dehydrogenase [Pseudomonadales bacterium]